MRAGLIVAKGAKLTAPAAQATASSGPAAARPASMLAGSAMSMRMSPDFEPAVTMSWRGESSAATARPSTPRRADEENAEAFASWSSPGSTAFREDRRERAS